MSYQDARQLFATIDPNVDHATYDLHMGLAKLTDAIEADLQQMIQLLRQLVSAQVLQESETPSKREARTRLGEWHPRRQPKS